MPGGGLRLNLKLDLFLVAVLFTAIVSYAVVILAVSDRLEQDLLHKLVSSEFFAVEAQLKTDGAISLPNQSVTRAWFAQGAGHALPAALKALSDGISHDIKVDGHRFHVFKGDVLDGKLIVGVDISAIEAREDTLIRTIVIGGMVVLVLLILIGRFFTRRLAWPIVSMARELDAAKAGDAELSFSNRYIDGEPGTIAKALDRYIERIAQMLERERSFSAAASHELRSPLTVIRSSLELALQVTDLPPRSRATLERANNQAQRLNDMLDGLMLLARDQAVAKPGSLELAPLTGEIVKGFNESLKDKPQAPLIEWQSEHSPRLAVEDSYWRILLSNLIRNALEHSGARRIRVRLDAKGICVEDDGRGVEQALLPQIFEHGQRNAGSLGAGLGLYIVAEICRRQNWRPEADNSALGGLKVCIWF